MNNCTKTQKKVVIRFNFEKTSPQNQKIYYVNSVHIFALINWFHANSDGKCCIFNLNFMHVGTIYNC